MTTTDNTWVVDDNLDRVDWALAKADLASDNFDNGRSPAALQRSFEQSSHVALAWWDDTLVGMVRMLSDGVCNAYLLDVWTHSSVRGRGIASDMVNRLKEAVPGEHIGLQTDAAEHSYTGLGFRRQPHFLSRVAGRWLDNDANRFTEPPETRA